MGRGINRYEGKDRRRQRMRNHIAKDLHKNKYHQRVVKPKRSDPPTFEYDEEEVDD